MVAISARRFWPRLCCWRRLRRQSERPLQLHRDHRQRGGRAGSCAHRDPALVDRRRTRPPDGGLESEARPRQAPGSKAGKGAGKQGKAQARVRGPASASREPLNPRKPRSPRALQETTTVGYLWSSEMAGYALRYAGKIDESRRIAADHPDHAAAAGRGQSTSGDPPSEGASNTYEFSVIELRLNAKGEGEGKASLTGKVVRRRRGQDRDSRELQRTAGRVPRRAESSRTSLERDVTGDLLCDCIFLHGSRASDSVRDGAPSRATSPTPRSAATKPPFAALILKKADVNAPQIDGTTALHWAVAGRRPGAGRSPASLRSQRLGRDRRGRHAAAAGRPERQRGDARASDRRRAPIRTFR